MKRSGMQTAEMAERLQEVLETKEEAVRTLTADVLLLTNQVGELGLALNEARARSRSKTFPFLFFLFFVPPPMGRRRPKTVAQKK